jgi:large subunit ribosomal protein L15e
MIDTHHPAIIKDKQLGVFCQANGNMSHRGRAYRGKTSAGKRGRGLFNKGKGAEKLRPSLKANLNRGK